MDQSKEEKNFKVSLIIPAYNEEKLIGECLDYVKKNADGKFLEIIVVDNNSTDSTRKVAETKGVQVITEEKKGVTKARQAGYKIATGEIIAFIDADTQMPKGWYEKVVAEFQDPHLALLSGPYKYYDFPQWLQYTATMWYSCIAIPVSKIVGYMAIAGNLAMRKDVLDKMGGLDTSIEFYGDDTNTARRAYAFGKVKFSSDFIIFTSGRRFLNQGLWNTTEEYFMNFFSEVFRHKPLHNKKYQGFRDKKPVS